MALFKGTEQVEVQKVVTEDVYTLQFTEDEMHALYAILGNANAWDEGTKGLFETIGDAAGLRGFNGKPRRYDVENMERPYRLRRINND